jgi:hypothetical protein
MNGNFVLGCGPGTHYPQIHISQCMLQQTDAITNKVLEPITFVLAYPTVSDIYKITMLQCLMNPSTIITLGYGTTALKDGVCYVGGSGVEH